MSPQMMAVGLLTVMIAVGGAALWKPSQAQSAPSPANSIPVQYTDVREAAGIIFQHEATMTPEKNYIETVGNGVGWIDYDQDGLMDLYFVQSTGTDWFKPSRPLRSALYHNNGEGTFTDVTEKAGVGAEGLY